MGLAGETKNLAIAVLQIWSLNKLCSFRKRDNYIRVWPVNVARYMCTSSLRCLIITVTV